MTSPPPTMWQEYLATLVSDARIRYSSDAPRPPPAVTNLYGYDDAAVSNREEEEEESLKEQVKGFLKATGEMMVEFGKGCRDIVEQSLEGAEELHVVKKVRGPVKKLGWKLEFLNEYLPEDRDPVHSWTVVILVILVAVSVLSTNGGQQTSMELPKKLLRHPPSASHVLLPDGRRIAYQEKGVSSERARFSMVVPHSFLSSRLAGLPGTKASLLEEFGLADAVGIIDKFWVVGYSGGGKHAWSAVRYIPERLAGVAMFAPMGNPYDSSMTKEERYKTWEKWTTKRKLMYVLARRLPSLLPYFYRRSFLSGMQGQLEKWLSLSLGKKDKSLSQEQVFREFWERDVEESVRQGDPKPFVEEDVLQVSDWGFNLADLQVQKKNEGGGLLYWLKSLFTQSEKEWAGFLGPIHIWQGMDDRVVPPSMTEFVRRVVPGATVHKLLDEGHFSYYCFCDECHRKVFSTLFGIPQGPVMVFYALLWKVVLRDVSSDFSIVLGSMDTKMMRCEDVI